MLPLPKRGVARGITQQLLVLIITLGLIRLTVGNTQPIAPPQTGYTLVVATLHCCHHSERKGRIVGGKGRKRVLRAIALPRKMIGKERESERVES